MAGFKDLSFNERREASQKAREAALAKLKNKPERDPAEQARRIAAAEAREAAQAEKRRAKEAQAQAAEAAREAEAQAVEAAREADAKAAEAAKPPAKVKPTEEERKAARDAKYAARKKRRGR